MVGVELVGEPTPTIAKFDLNVDLSN